MPRNSFSLSLLAGIAASVFPLAFLRAAEFVDADICIYGGTSGGVIAAVEAARLGKRVVLVVFNNHLGGMTSAGLGWTDLGSFPDAIQGMAREFYTRVGRKYGGTSAKFTFEPKVAEQVFNEMIQEAGVPVYFNQRLAGATMSGKRLTAITMESGNVFRAAMFIDCTYEGDLMARAGVTYTIGREPNSQYGETINGIQAALSVKNQLPDGIDPYVVPGDPGSGLLPGVNATPGGADGTGDSRVQAYCYRMCLTNVPSNRVMIAKPEGYNEADYEILFRAIATGQTGNFWKLDAMPNGKTDSNNASGISTDFIGGGSDEWAEASYERREEIARAHEKWQRGLVWTVQNSPRVPASIRNAWSQWGLPKDEFLDTDHWPHQLYVREARRMVSDYVMLEHNCRGTRVAPDSIGLACYTMDSHNTQRIVRSGMVKNEGDVQIAVPKPYPISYRSVVPRVGECENLFVTFALSASHMGFGSCRMEPVFMITSQSAAAAACISIDDEVAVQDVSYPRLKAQMLADGQKLTWDSDAEDNSIIIDNADGGSVTLTGDWPASTATSGYYGANYLHDNNEGKGAKAVRFRPNFAVSGTYEVFVRWTAHTNRASNVPIDLISSAGVTTRIVDQRQQNGTWVSLGTCPFSVGTAGSVLIRNTSTDGYVVADAVKFQPVDALPTVSLWATNASVREPVGTAATSPGIITIARAGDTTSPLTVELTLGGTALNGIDYAEVSSSVTIPAGSTYARVAFHPQADLLAEGTETITVGLAPSVNYAISETLAWALVRIKDRPFDAWRRARFTPVQLEDPDVSGDFADADSDGLSTLAEFVAQKNPLAPDNRGLGVLGIRSVGDRNYLSLVYTRVKADDVTVAPQISDDLKNWRSDSDALTQTILNDDGQSQTILVRDVFPVDTQQRRFLRLNIERVK